MKPIQPHPVCASVLTSVSRDAVPIAAVIRELSESYSPLHFLTRGGRQRTDGVPNFSRGMVAPRGAKL